MKRYVCTFAAFVVLCAIATPSTAQTGGNNCYNCYSDGTYLYCSLLQPSGGKTCKQPNPYTCTLVGACGQPGGCFLAGTLVATPGGDIPIEYLQVGDAVVAQTEDGDQTVARVSETFRYIQCSFYRINGSLEVTGSHPFWLDGEWVEAGDIKAGCQLLDDGGQAIEVKSIERIDRASRVYNIEVDGPHTFFAYGVLVHNKEPDPQS